jgi:DNA-binding MarR family transcriptional regulator
MSRRSTSADAPDLGILLALAFRVYVDELHAELAARGFPDMKPGFGVVFRALQAGPLTLTQLAAQLGISKQAAAKVVGELLERGFLVQEEEPEDRRTKLLALTQRGRAVVRAAMQIGARVEARLGEEVGPRAVAGLRAALEHLVVSGGDEADMRARRARPVW